MAGAGYSGAPLWRKPGYADGLRALAIGALGKYGSLLGLPEGVRVDWLRLRRRGMAFVQLFAGRSAAPGREPVRLRREISPCGVVRVSWPKSSSGVPTDITGDVIRECALPLGFVDIKVCALDETWPGLKPVIRRSER